MENLDYDVLENILSCLPLGAVSQAKRVCKLWKTIMDDRIHKEAGFLFSCGYGEDKKFQFFFGEQYDHIDGNKMNYYYSHETLMEMKHCRFSFKRDQYGILVGSCNGLVCIEKNREPFAICNPLTGEFIFLKEYRAPWLEDAPKLFANGFGYCQSTKEYKVVRLPGQNYEYSDGQIYTLGSNEWRHIKLMTYTHLFPRSGIFANGVLHWLGEKRDDSTDIVAFDLEDEKFRELPPPEALGRGGNELKLLGGNLCLVKRGFTYMDIWAYKRKFMEEHDQKHDYYSKNSWNWVKEFSIKLVEHDSTPFAITKGNQVLLLCSRCVYCYDSKRLLCSRHLHCYDSKTDTISNLGDYNGTIQAIPHLNSYVSLKDYGETWYGPGCSAVPQTISSHVSLTEVTDDYWSRERNMQS